MKHRFVDEIPQSPDEGILYISIRYKIVVHLCACGCKNKVVTRISPKDWKLTFDGNGITLYPSVGNWNFKCQSHYWVKNNSIIIVDEGSKVKKKREKKALPFLGSFRSLIFFVKKELLQIKLKY